MYEVLWIASIVAILLIPFGLRAREIYLAHRWQPAIATIIASYPAYVGDVESLFVDAEFVLDDIPYKSFEINTRQRRRAGFEPGSVVPVFVNPADPRELILDKRDVNFIDLLARSFVMWLFPTSSRRNT